MTNAQHAMFEAMFNSTLKPMLLKFETEDLLQIRGLIVGAIDEELAKRDTAIVEQATKGS